MVEETQFNKDFQEAFREMLAVPANQLSLSTMFFEVALEAMKQQQRDMERRSFLPVVARTYYPGSVKAIVAFNEDDKPESGMKADLFEEDGEGGWRPLNLPESVGNLNESIQKLVLSQATHFGDEWYITTSAQVDAVSKEVADGLMKTMSQQ